MKQVTGNTSVVRAGSAHVAAGTAGGTVCCVLGSISFGALMETAVLAAVGATVSYVLSVGLRWLTGKIKERRHKEQG